MFYTLKKTPLEDFLFETFEGKVPFHVGITISAENDTFGTTAETIRPLSDRYIFPSAAGVVSVVSDDAEDSLTGTGIRQLVVRGLDANYEPINEVVETDGLTPVTTTREFLRINEMNVEIAGSNNGAVGNITASIGGNPAAYIELGRNITRQGVFTVPLGTNLYVTSFHVSLGKDNEALAKILVTNPDNNIPIEQSTVFGYQNVTDILVGGVIKVPAKHDLEFTCVKTVVGAAASISVFSSSILVVDK